jgi:Asp-tRNA(Asn)/Glu-tRNA(Gln) amidotransferase B subunit
VLYCALDGIFKGRNAKEVLVVMFGGDNRSPHEIVTSKGWTQLSNTFDLESLCLTIIRQNPKEVSLVLFSISYDFVL